MLVVTTVFAVAAVAAAFGTGFLVGHYVSDGEAPCSKAGCSKLRLEIEALTKGLKNAAVSLNAAKEENAGLAKRVAGLTRHYLDQTERMREIDQLRADAETRSTELESENELLRERGRNLAAKITEQAKVTEQASEVLDIQEKLTVEFEDSPIRAQKAPSREISRRENASAG
jgi:chromosome segregation ATPase